MDIRIILGFILIMNLWDLVAKLAEMNQADRSLYGSTNILQFHPKNK